MQNLTLLTKQPRSFRFYPWACATSLIYKLPTHDNSQAHQHFSSSLTGRLRFGITLLSHCNLGRWPSYIKRPPQRASSSSLSVETSLANSLSSDPSQVKQPRTILRPSLHFFDLSIPARTHISARRNRDLRIPPSSKQSSVHAIVTVQDVFSHGFWKSRKYLSLELTISSTFHSQSTTSSDTSPQSRHLPLVLHPRSSTMA